MTSPQEWLTIRAIRFRLWSLAVYDSTDNAATANMDETASALITAHIMDWYGDVLPADEQGIGVIEWGPLLEFVQGSRPDLWPAAKGKATNKVVAKRARGTSPVERNRVKNRMLDAIKAGTTPNELNAMKREALAKTYGAKSRDTAVKALVEIMSELTPTKVRQTPTNSDTN